MKLRKRNRQAQSKTQCKTQSNTQKKQTQKTRHSSTRKMHGNKKKRAQNKKRRDSEQDWTVKGATRILVLAVLLGMNMPESSFPDIDVARYGGLQRRARRLAAENRKEPIHVTRGLVIVDDNNKVMLVYLPTAVAEK